jgi:UDP-glucose 4-epimerase
VNTLSSHSILITGAAGFIGSHLCAALIAQGHDVHALSRSKPRISDPLLHWHKVDLTHARATQRAFHAIRADVVFDLCSNTQDERDLAMVGPTFRDELETTIHVLTALAETGCKRLILAGSLEEPEPGRVALSPSGAAKAASRIYAGMFHHVYGLPVVMARVFMAYGPGQPARKAMAECIRAMLAHTPVHLHDPQRQFDWIYIDDVVEGLIRAASATGVEGKSVDLGSGTLTSVLDIAEQIKMITGSSSPIHADSFPTRRHEHAPVADVLTAHTLLQWSPRTSLLTGLESTIRHCRESNPPSVIPPPSRPSAHMSFLD